MLTRSMLRTGLAVAMAAAVVALPAVGSSPTLASTPPAAAERVVVLGEEDVLGDLLALGVEAVAPVLVVPDGLDSAAQITFLGEQFGATDEADALVAELDAAQTDAAETLDGVEVTVAAIYPGPAPAVFVDGPWVVPQVLIDAGATLVPDAAAASLEPDQNGRVYLSTEQIELLSAPQIVLMQTDLVEGDADAVTEIGDHPLWELLPAVEAGDVHTVDRLGYPGIEGHIRAIDDLVALLAGPDATTGDSSASASSPETTTP